MSYSKSEIKTFLEKSPVLKEVMSKKPVIWLNPNKRSGENQSNFSVTDTEISDAETLFQRFAQFFMQAFPETKESNGILESPLVEISNMKEVLTKSRTSIPGKLFLKCDHSLPIAGSIKARGGFFEVLYHAEKLAMQSGILKENDDYSIFASQKFKDFFSQYSIGVSSTGNLGLSIGILSASLGFDVKVYMSNDAKEWKKKLLQEKGAGVVEIDGDFSEAMSFGRKQTESTPNAYFVDDENSLELFLGYAVGGKRTAEQIKNMNIKIDKEHPLFVYSPCGVGGSPGGTAFGLKEVFGDAVHIFYVEPIYFPAVLIGLATGEMSNISVKDLGLDYQTEADGLAVGRPSKFATEISDEIISGIFTIEDDDLFRLLAHLKDSEDIFVEPSAAAGLIGPQIIGSSGYLEKHNINPDKITHLAWSTGGDLVPTKNRKEFYQRGKDLLNSR